MVLEVYLKTLLFYAIEFLIILYYLKNYFQKALRTFEPCVLVNNYLCGKLFSLLESPTVFDEVFKVTSVPFFVPDFNLLSCKLDNFTFKVFQVIFYF